MEDLPFKIRESSGIDPVISVDKSKANKVYTMIGATTLPIRSAVKTKGGKVVKGEVLAKKALESMAERINDTSRHGGDVGSYRTISLFHNRVYKKDFTLEEAGYVLPTAKVVPMETLPNRQKFKGHHALVVDVEANQMYSPPGEYPDYTPAKIEYKLDKNMLGLSIEYDNEPHQEQIVKIDGEEYNHVLDTHDFRGFGFARPDLIADTAAVRVRESTQKNDKGETHMADENIAQQLADTQAKVREMEKQLEAAKGDDAKVRELQSQMTAGLEKLQKAQDAAEAKTREMIERIFSGINVNRPAATSEEKNAKVREVYQHAVQRDIPKFREAAQEYMESIEKNDAKVREFTEQFSAKKAGVDFEEHQTLQVKCRGSQMVLVPSAKTRDVINADSMAESTLYQTNAMFADRYVAEITETFLHNDGLLKVMPKIQHMGGNDKYQWKLWVDYVTVTGTNTLAVDPNNTSVSRTKRSFIKVETPICEYRDGVEVTDFTAYHSMAAVGDLMGEELNRAAEAVTESMQADLYKAQHNGVSSWLGFTGLIYIADSTTYTSYGGKTRSTANRMAADALTDTYVTTSEGISVEVIRNGYEKVLSQGSSLGDLAIAIHPTQCRRLFNSEDAAIRNQILTMAGAPATFGFARALIPHVDGIPMIRDYYCESSASAKDMFAVVDLSPRKGFCLVVSKPLGARGLAKVGTSESAYVNFWGNTVYKAPRNVFVHTSLSTA